ncbi:SPOR domain-containing protein [Prolixibacteraceae bacterium JC049]|nr:SPOR domain-containing protein [Prolixibacteraceae bacterium JC049]
MMRKVIALSLIVLGASFTSCNSLKKLSGKSKKQETTNTEELTAQDGNSNYFAAEPTTTAKQPASRPATSPAKTTSSRKISMRAEKFTFDQKSDENKNSSGKFFVIVGSFGQRDNADRFKQQLAAQGFKPFILLSETGNLRICINSYFSENAARSRVMQIRTDYPKYADAWLLIKN